MNVTKYSPPLTDWVHLPPQITVYQLEWMICPFPTGMLECWNVGMLEWQPVTIPLPTGLKEASLLFPFEIHSTDHFVSCQGLHSLSSQMTKPSMPNRFLGAFVIGAWTSLVTGTSLVKVVETSFSESRGYELGLGVSDFTSHLGENGYLAFLGSRGYAVLR